MAEWTCEQVAERLVEAADVLRRLPEEKARGFHTLWPKVIPEFSDLIGREPDPLCRPPPSPQAISRMEETFGWLRWLEPDELRLVWMRAERRPWKAVCRRFGVSRATAHRHWVYAVSVIVWRLNGRRPPRRRSQQFVIERARTVSSKKEALRHFLVRHFSSQRLP